MNIPEDWHIASASADDPTADTVLARHNGDKVLAYLVNERGPHRRPLWGVTVTLAGGDKYGLECDGPAPVHDNLAAAKGVEVPPAVRAAFRQANGQPPTDPMTEAAAAINACGVEILQDLDARGRLRNPEVRLTGRRLVYLNDHGHVVFDEPERWRDTPDHVVRACVRRLYRRGALDFHEVEPLIEAEYAAAWAVSPDRVAEFDATTPVTSTLEVAALIATAIDAAEEGA